MLLKSLIKMFILEYIICYCLVMFAMCIDNICWISSSGEYNLFRKLGLIKSNGNKVTMDNKVYTSKFDYVLNYRVKSVLTDFRDIVPALVTALLMAIIGAKIW